MATANDAATTDHHTTNGYFALLVGRFSLIESHAHKLQVIFHVCKNSTFFLQIQIKIVILSNQNIIQMMVSFSSLFKSKKKDTSVNIIRLEETDSTNNYLRSYQPADAEKITVVTAEFQTAGRGQGSNTWESQKGKNLTFSILVHPVMVPLQRQFLLSMTGGIALKMALAKYTDGITLKWPNDVYWNDRKLSGTLIETTLSGGHITNCIFGIGLNVNQSVFTSSAPNPVSLAQILGHEVDREELLQEIIKAFKYSYSLIENGNYTDIAALYHNTLYRSRGFHAYRDRNGEFEAAIVEVEDNGHLILRDHEGIIKEYAFKEVEFII